MSSASHTPYHLLDEAWIPVRRASGVTQMISPLMITSHPEDPIQAIASPRPDLDAALAQFLIGLFQVAMAPSGDSWRELLEQPPDRAHIERALKPVHHAFFLNGDGPRFMQELGGLDQDPQPITDLFVNAPGDQTRRNNVDFFVKRSDAALGHAAAAAALYALQVNAYGGGAGYRTSLRGGGPLTTIIRGRTLWHTIWANVMDADRVDLAQGLPEDLSLIFPWLAPTRTSEKKSGVETTPADVHPAQAFWSMSWRVQLRLSRQELGPCALYPDRPARYTGFAKTNFGVNYTGPWLHPLTPYRFEDKKGTLEHISIKATSRSFRFTSWPDVALTARIPEGAKKYQRPAQVLAYMASERLDGRAGKRLGRQHTWLRECELWLFGFEMDNAKALQWHEATTPFVQEPLPGQHALRTYCERLIEAASSVEDVLFQRLRRLLYGDVTLSESGLKWKKLQDSAPKRSHTLIAPTLESYWAMAAPAFFEATTRAHDLMLEHGAPQPPELEDISQAWLERLHAIAKELFERHTPQDTSLLKDMRAVVLARRELRMFTSPRGKNLRKLVGLAPLPKDPSP